MRITAHLIDARSNRERWAESYERDSSDVLALQNEVALAIASELRVRLTPAGKSRLDAQARTVNPTAYDYYLRALTLLERVNGADTEAAIGMLEQAVALDPGFADAFGALATAYYQMYAGYQPERASALEPKVRAALDKALSLDPESADALAVQGDLGWDAAHGWRHEEAIQGHRRAIIVKPNFERSHRRLAVIFNHVGFADHALRELEQSDDSPAILMQKGLAFRIQGKHDLALASWLAIQPSSRNTNHVGHIAWVLSDLGRREDARILLRQVPPDTTDVNGMLSAARALLHAVAGERQEAEVWIDRSTARAVDTQESHHATYLVASAYARLGNPGESVRWLRFTASNGFPCYPLMARDSNLDSLRSYPPFVQFLGELKTRWEGYRARLGE